MEKTVFSFLTCEIFLKVVSEKLLSTLSCP